MFTNATPLNGFAETGIGSTYITPKRCHVNVDPAGTDFRNLYPLGTIVRYWNSVLGGEGACAYLQFNDGTADQAIVAGSGVVMKAGETYVVTSDYSDGFATGGAPFAIATATVTSTYYGWFWISGVPPLFRTAAATYYHAATITTDGNLDAGECFTAGSTDIAILPYANTSVQMIVGVSSTADTSTAVALQYLRLFGTGWF